jgi:hypothetical protein
MSRDGGNPSNLDPHKSGDLIHYDHCDSSLEGVTEKTSTPNPKHPSNSTSLVYMMKDNDAITPQIFPDSLDGAYVGLN